MTKRVHSARKHSITPIQPVFSMRAHTFTGKSACLPKMTAASSRIATGAWRTVRVGYGIERESSRIDTAESRIDRGHRAIRTESSRPSPAAASRLREQRERHAERRDNCGQLLGMSTHDVLQLARQHVLRWEEPTS